MFALLSNESIVTIVTAAATILTLYIKGYFDHKKLLVLREQDRLDRESDAHMRRADKQELLQAGDERKDEILKETKQVKAVAVKSALKSEEAIRVANGHNEKIAAAVAVSQEVLKTIRPPSESPD